MKKLLLLFFSLFYITLSLNAMQSENTVERIYRKITNSDIGYTIETAITTELTGLLSLKVIATLAHEDTNIIQSQIPLVLLPISISCGLLLTGIRNYVAGTAKPCAGTLTLTPDQSLNVMFAGSPTYTSQITVPLNQHVICPYNQNNNLWLPRYLCLVNQQTQTGSELEVIPEEDLQWHNGTPYSKRPTRKLSPGSSFTVPSPEEQKERKIKGLIQITSVMCLFGAATLYGWKMSNKS